MFPREDCAPFYKLMSDHEFLQNLVKVAVDPKTILLWQCYDKIHCQEQDRCMNKWRQFVFFYVKLSSLARWRITWIINWCVRPRFFTTTVQFLARWLAGFIINKRTWKRCFMQMSCLYASDLPFKNFIYLTSFGSCHCKNKLTSVFMHLSSYWR